LEELLNNYNNPIAISDVKLNIVALVVAIIIFLILAVFCFCLILLDDAKCKGISIAIAGIIVLGAFVWFTSYVISSERIQKERLKEIISHEDSSELVISDRYIVYGDIVIRHNKSNISNYIVRLNDGTYMFIEE
jgi:hypothetical protein